mgnify:CR=1 FL=1
MPKQKTHKGTKKRFRLSATGKAMQAILGVTYPQGILAGGIIIIVYTLMGGFRAVSWTDFFQGMVMVFALVVMPVLVIVKAGGYGAMLHRLAAEYVFHSETTVAR